MSLKLLLHLLLGLLLCCVGNFSAAQDGNDSPLPRNQFLDKLQVYFGTTLHVTPIEDKLTNESLFASGNPVQYGLTLGANYVFWHSNDVFSLSAAPSFSLAFNLNSNPVSLFLQTPLYLLARVGAGATSFNQNVVGFGVGIGGNFSFIRFPFGYEQPQPNGNPSIYREGLVNQPYFTPAAMAELTINYRSSIFCLRGHANLSRYSGELILDDRTDDRLAANFYGWGIGFHWYFF